MIKIPEDRLICCLKAFIINDSWKVRNMGAIYLGILSIQMGLQFFEEFLEQSFIILLTDASKYYFINVLIRYLLCRLYLIVDI